MKHLISTADLDLDWIEEVMDLASIFDEKCKSNFERAHNKILATLFYEPSTRTRMSFETAMLRLDGKILSVPDMAMSSSKKGESLSDTAKIVSNYADIIVTRHYKNGAVMDIALGANVPVINAGDGANEHPSQALLDLYTIKKAKGNLNGLKIALVGDLKFGRTVHSLAMLLGKYGAELIFVSPQQLSMPQNFKEKLQSQDAKYIETETLDDILGDIDVFYQTRVQEERFVDHTEYEKYRSSYIVDQKVMSKCKEDMILMHPLPRIVEITPEVDNDPRAYYFKQAKNAVPVRMAIISKLLETK